MFPLALWGLQLIAPVGGLIFLIMNIVKKSIWMKVLRTVLLLLPFATKRFLGKADDPTDQQKTTTLGSQRSEGYTKGWKPDTEIWVTMGD